MPKAHRLRHLGRPAGPWRLDPAECGLDALDQGWGHRERHENGHLGRVYLDIFTTIESADASTVETVPLRGTTR